MLFTRLKSPAMIRIIKMLTKGQIDEVCKFQGSLNRRDEWLFFNISAVRAMKENDGKVTFEDKYETMKLWDKMKNEIYS